MGQCICWFFSWVFVLLKFIQINVVLVTHCKQKFVYSPLLLERWFANIWSNSAVHHCRCLQSSWWNNSDNGTSPHIVVPLFRRTQNSQNFFRSQWDRKSRCDNREMYAECRLYSSVRIQPMKFHFSCASEWSPNACLICREREGKRESKNNYLCIQTILFIVFSWVTISESNCIAFRRISNCHNSENICIDYDVKIFPCVFILNVTERIANSAICNALLMF